MKTKEYYSTEAIRLLGELVSTPSLSREEENTGNLIESFLRTHGCITNRNRNNIWARNRHFDREKPVLLLNSHHDTVKPNQGYTRDPFQPFVEDGKLYGLGSNDAGGALTSLLATFLFFHDRQDLPFNLIYAATAEEEISGRDGIELILPELGPISCAIVGEPTQMQMAIAEKGLMVLDATVYGRSGHAAREEGESALYKALDDIAWIRGYRFDRDSDLLGPVRMSVTIIHSGTQHNVVPDQCTYTIDVRVNECYTLEEVLAIIRANTSGELTPRSLRMRSSVIPPEHPLVQAGLSLGRTCYGSPTTSDKALMPFPALKMGPGDSARSHTADEYIYLDEIVTGVDLYINLLDKFGQNLINS
ncbi:MAG: M20 family metallo-hydrolase [Bacteroidota bacterium]